MRSLPLRELSMSIRRACCFILDDDRMTLDGNRFFEPEFKPDFDPELLETTNYIGRFFLVKRDFFEKYGSVDADFSGACDYDLPLRLTEAATKEQLIHIPRILCHIRMEEGVSAGEEEWEKARLALTAHYERLGGKGHGPKGREDRAFPDTLCPGGEPAGIDSHSVPRGERSAAALHRLPGPEIFLSEL